MNQVNLFNVYGGSHWSPIIDAMGDELVHHLENVTEEGRTFYDTDGYIEQVVQFATITFHMGRLALRAGVTPKGVRR